MTKLGIYVHIPFCRRACPYCDFHFSTNLKQKNELIDAIVREAHARRDFFAHIPDSGMQSIYLGGGTPSLLDISQLELILQHLYEIFNVEDSPGLEVTLEANPDDLTAPYLEQLAQTRVNRLSIGVQSFQELDLKWMRRLHNADEARNCIIEAAKWVDTGALNSLSADLIYGFPQLDAAQWTENLNILFDLPLQHFSAYSLTVEDGTALKAWIRDGRFPQIDSNHAAMHLEMLMEAAADAGFEHYEISNFARRGFQAVHNSAYWKHRPYLGLGPSAHSFDGEKRYWNPSDNLIYAQNWLSKKPEEIRESESLGKLDLVNEKIMTGLRKLSGLNLERVDSKFHMEILSSAKKWADQGELIITDNNIRLSRKGVFLADRIMSDLFIVE
jgi:oxygen-independent coproporphyrinogen-3 oxidase